MRRRSLLHSVLPVLLCLAGGPRPAATEGRRATCKFSNPSFSGFCSETVEVGDGQTATQACRVVLTCLNDSTCTKTYCSATTIRTGWRLEQATPTAR